MPARAQLEATQRADAEARARATAAQGGRRPGNPRRRRRPGLGERTRATSSHHGPRHRPAVRDDRVDRRRNRGRDPPLDPSLLFVDGPSTGPSVVSVYAGAAGWAAAVGGAHGTCYWVAVALDGRTRYGTGTPCTGMAALAADRGAW